MKKESRTFYFSVEGECEERYLKHLQTIINADPQRNANAKFRIKVEKNPISFIKGFAVVNKINAHHITDIESNEIYYQEDFKNTLDNLAKAKRLMPAKVKKYILGYCNFTFELWLILHKHKMAAAKNHRSDYLQDINRVFHKNFYDLDEFKQKDNFLGIINKFTLEDVKRAITNADEIMNINHQRAYVLQHYRTYKYYRENPSLSLHEILKKILNVLGLY